MSELYVLFEQDNWIDAGCSCESKPFVIGIYDSLDALNHDLINWGFKPFTEEYSFYQNHSPYRSIFYEKVYPLNKGSKPWWQPTEIKQHG